MFIKFKPIDKRGQQYVDLYNKIHKYILKVMRAYPKMSSEYLLQKIKSRYDLEFMKMKLEISFDKLIDKPYYQNILNYYNNNELLKMDERYYINNSVDKMIDYYDKII